MGKFILFSGNYNDWELIGYQVDTWVEPDMANLIIICHESGKLIIRLFQPFSFDHIIVRPHCVAKFAFLQPPLV